ncbi:hypothetical protein ACTXT7_004341 [Hymenolepis weldensis]
MKNTDYYNRRKRSKRTQFVSLAKSHQMSHESAHITKKLNKLFCELMMHRRLLRLPNLMPKIRKWCTLEQRNVQGHWCIRMQIGKDRDTFRAPIPYHHCNNVFVLFNE